MAVSINGSGDVRLQQIESQECQASISGSGNINLNGKAIQASYSIAGSGNIQAAICKQKTQTQALAAPATSAAMPVRSWLPASKEAVILPIKEILKKWMRHEKIYGRSNKDSLNKDSLKHKRATASRGSPFI